VPGIQATGLDVSSACRPNFFTARGGRGNEGTIQIDGMNVGSAFNGGGVAGFGYPIGESSEIQVTICRRPRRRRIAAGRVQPDSEDRWQQLQRHGISEHRRQVVAGRQPRRQSKLRLTNSRR
jgi:hypothetical protein